MVAASNNETGATPPSGSPPRSCALARSRSAEANPTVSRSPGRHGTTAFPFSTRRWSRHSRTGPKSRCFSAPKRDPEPSTLMRRSWLTRSARVSGFRTPSEEPPSFYVQHEHIMRIGRDSAVPRICGGLVVLCIN